ncbi:MAG: hypothetical protein R3B13_31690 [Polyangiaceae bacterium]
MENEVGERPRERRAPVGAEREAARLARLATQLAQTLPGNLYDLSGLPPSLMFVGATAAARNDIAALHRLWSHAKAIAGQGLEPQRALCWVATHAARLLARQGQLEGARAKLETALNHLEDAGHRSLIRVELCIQALRQGDIAAARGWLAECDPAPEVIELDSALRHARARLALAEGEPLRALSQIGESPGSVPVAPSLRPQSDLIRVHAYEAAGRGAQAKSHWRRAAKEHGEGRLIALAHAEDLAPETRLAPMSRRAQTLASEARNAGSLSYVLRIALLYAPLFCAVLALLFSVEGFATGSGPMLGITAEPACAAVCEGCTAPITYHLASSDNVDHAVLCDSAAIHPRDMSPRELSQYQTAFPHLAIPGGVFTLYLLTFVAVYPLGFALALWPAIRRRRRVALAAAANQEELAELTAALRAVTGAQR